MILYVNGDSHSAAAEAVNQHAFAEDDSKYFYMGRQPHPDNLQASWGRLLSLSLQAAFKCDAESASSNSRILRTTREYLANQTYNEDILVIIQWSTWEREEWYDEESKQYFQVNASGIDQVPQAWQEKYRQYIMGIDWQAKTEEAHDQIWAFHKELEAQGIKHIFVNGNTDFSKIKDQDQRAWNMCYVAPYEPTMTFDAIVRKQGIETVAPNSYHFGKDAHSFFNRFMLQYIITNKFI
jgi:hypothetical protein